MKYFVHIVCNEIQVKVNLEITTFFFYLRFQVQVQVELYCHSATCGDSGTKCRASQDHGAT